MEMMNGESALPRSTGYRCGACCAPAGAPHIAGCMMASVDAAAGLAADMLDQLDHSRLPLAVPAAVGVLRTALAAQLAEGSAGQVAPTLAELADPEIVEVLASLGIDSEKSKYPDNPVLQVHTTVPEVRKIVAAYLKRVARPVEGAGQADQMAIPRQLLEEATGGSELLRDCALSAIRSMLCGSAPTERAAAPAEPDKDDFARGVIAALGVLNAHGYSHGSVYHDEIVQSVGEASVYAAAEEDDYRWAGLDPSKKPRHLATHQPSAQDGGEA